MLVGLAVGPFWVQNPNTDYVCNSTLAVPRSSPAFLDWQVDIEFKMYYYLLGQAVFATLIALLGFCKCSRYDQLLAGTPELDYYPVRVCAAGLCVWSCRFVYVRTYVYVYL